ncbi:MAG: sensor histidine kinase [Rhodobacterales bacterium]|nr:sensor histidine kinase [Rhodobacterales bacterium]
MGRTAWVSPILLVILVGLVMTGAGITLRSAAREIRLSRLQTDFVSSISHELRTPLTSIRMFVETLQSARLQDPERVAECLDLLAKETDRLSRMIERVLGWARMEAGRRSYELEDVRADDLVNEALQALRSQHLLGLQSPEIDVDIPEDTPLLRVDRDAIVEALLNLLQNAAKYTPEPRKISVRARVKLPLVGLAVIDNGPGIAKADRNRVFEKFYQADTLLSATSRFGSQRGSGLGLSIVRAAVHGHGGRVTLETELGYGSTFTLWLPLTDSA